MILDDTEGIIPMNKTRFIAVALASTLFAGASTATASADTSGQASVTIELSGYVPVICRANVAATQVVVQEGQTSIGQLTEFCNSPSGYQVWVDYSPSLANASLIVDGKTVQLDASGSTLIDSSSTARIATRDLAIDQTGEAAQGNLSVRVVAL